MKKKCGRGKWEVKLKYDGVPIFKRDKVSDDELESIFKDARLKTR